MNLTDISHKYATDKGNKCDDHHNYTPIYEAYIGDNRENIKNIMEIGIGYVAASLKMWEEYLPNANVIGVDIDSARMYSSNRIKTFTASQTDASFFNRFEDGYFDIIIDDGSHESIHQMTTLGFLFKKVKSGGLYIIEDMQTSLMNGWDLPANHQDTCLSAIRSFEKNGKLKSPYISEDNIKYINNNSTEVKVYDTKNRNLDIISFIRKK